MGVVTGTVWMLVTYLIYGPALWITIDINGQHYGVKVPTDPKAIAFKVVFPECPILANRHYGDLELISNRP